MWNPFKRLAETDRARLRRLENELGELSDVIEQVLQRTGRIDARLRKRARVAAADTGDGDDSPNGAGSAVEALAAPQPEGVEQFAGRLTKEQLRANARARGLLH